MGIYNFLIQAYNQFLTIFPPSVQWLITLLIIIGLIGAAVHLVRQNVVFIVVVLVLLPFLIPVIGSFIHDLSAFVGYLFNNLFHTVPAPSP